MDESTRALMQTVAEGAAHKAVSSTLVSLGLDTAKPIEAQRNMLALRDIRELVTNTEFQKDLIYMRKFRKTMEGIESKGYVAAISMVCLGGLAIIAYSFRLKIFGA